MIQDAVARKQKQQELLSKKRKADAAATGRQQSTEEEAATNKYLKQKSQHEAMAGSMGDDTGGKWLVR